MPILGKVRDLFLSLDDGEPVRADDDTGQDEGDERLDFDPVEDHADNERDGEYDQDVGEEFKDHGDPPGLFWFPDWGILSYFI